MSEQPNEILTIDEVAAYLKAGNRADYRLASSGITPAGQSWWHEAITSKRRTRPHVDNAFLSVTVESPLA